METPPEETIISQVANASDKNVRRDSLLSLTTFRKTISAPAYSASSEKTNKFELYICPSFNSLPGSINSFPVPKMAILGFLNTLTFPYQNVAIVPTSLGVRCLPLGINKSPSFISSLFIRMCFPESASK